ncbi:hypothetical protein BS47DRAFT_1054322 [Hydnum rufescens UP504]|uniref:Uncharacterized protein n=1 Tax=Hydnum rufescens UP504 TaxID=1448309 RepID=A0A9P6AXD4_9AGAM|nr:hypothetical protein BS47DRAFT_1054322 [Hydnum rufescens UP504]
MFTSSMTLCLILLGIFSPVFSLPACVDRGNSTSKMALDAVCTLAPKLQELGNSTLWKSEYKSSSVASVSSSVKYLTKSTSSYAVSSSGSVNYQNGMEAINLNNAYTALHLPLACPAGAVACIELQLAKCGGDGMYSVTPCPSGTVCAALPLVGRRGTVVECTTPLSRTQQIAQALVS